jgi:acetyl-CoA carboxylase biotin carboxyl carrier protein
MSVSDDASKIPSPFDVSTIKNLVSLMSRHDLSEIDLREGELRIRLRRGPKGITVQSLPPAVAAPNSTPPPASPPATPPGPAAEAARHAKPLVEIKSPTPGTFYVAPSPDAQPFVRVGSKVTPTTVVAVIEAMKIFNEIPAECSGVIVEICVENQQPVEYGQVLFKVDPTG